MNKTDLINIISGSTDIPQKAVAAVVNEAFNTITQSLCEREPVFIPGFGTFKLSYHSARRGRNPITGAEINIPAKVTPAFKPGTKLKEKVGNQ